MYNKKKNYFWRIMKPIALKNPAKILALSLIIFFWGNCAAAVCHASSLDENIGRLSHIATSLHPENYAVIDAKGDTVSVSGKFTSDTVKSVSISGTQVSSDKFASEGEGRFSAELKGNPLENGYYDLYINFKSNVYMRYILGYDDAGWFIPDNGLCKANAEVLENVRQSEPIAAAYYISPTGDKDEIKATMDKIQTIAEQVCSGVEDDYEKAYLINRWIADNIYYDHDAAETEVTIETVALCNVLENHRTTCAGFANLFCALLEIEGIRSVNLKGAAASGEITYDNLTTGRENHEFTAFWYEKENRWAYADSCWSGVGNYRNGKYSDSISYDKYFDITGEAFSLDHRADKAEERHYTKALAAVEALEDTQILQTSETSEESVPQEENIQQTGETSVIDNGAVSDTNTASSAALATEKVSPSDISFDTPKEKGSLVPYIIIGIVGVIAVGAGIVLAVRFKKNNKQ